MEQRNFRRIQTQKWKDEQIRLRKQLILEFPTNLREKLNNKNLLVGGIDISFFKEDKSRAVVCLATINIANQQLVKYHCEEIQLTVPYIATFLAFREQPGCQQAIDAYARRFPNHLPDVLMVDGQGTLHPRGFGLACHVGVVSGIPTFGVAKEILQWDTTKRLTKEERRQNARETRYALRDTPPTEIENNGMIIRFGRSRKPVFISPGHLIDRDTAVEISRLTARSMIPEPTKQADRLSRNRVNELLTIDKMNSLSLS